LTEVKRFSPPDRTSAPRLTTPAYVWNRHARERRDEKLVSPPAGHRPLPGADEQETGQIEQHEQGYEPADGSQDAYYHRSLPLSSQTLRSHCQIFITSHG
jgi:hypothetical protein